MSQQEATNKSEAIPAPPRGEMPPAEVKKTVTRESLLRFQGLFKQHGERLNTAEPGDPVRVIHLEDPSRNYFLVPIFTNGLDEPWFVAQFSANSGEMLRLDSIRTAQPDENSWIYAVLNEKHSREKLTKLLEPHLPDGWRSVPPPDGPLVWKHCRFSHSPLHPFHMLERGPDGQKEYSYVDIFGDRHEDLDAPAPWEEEESPRGEENH